MLRSLRFAAVGLAATGLGLGAGSALAGGSLKDAPVPGVVYDWNGLSVGVGIGIGKFDQDVEGKAWRKDTLKKRRCYEGGNTSIAAVVPDCVNYGNWHTLGWDHDFLKGKASDDGWDWFGTLQVGYDRMLGDRILIGAFADFDFYPDSEVSFYKEKNKD